MAVPERRTRRRNTRSRRAQWKATQVGLGPLHLGGVVHRVPRRPHQVYARGLLQLP